MSDGACRSPPGRTTCRTAIAIASSTSNRYFYRYGNDGLVYRFDRANSLVSSVIPLMSSGLFLGEPLPLGYDVYNVPFAYRSYYRDTSDYLYRYDGNAIYRVNAEQR